MNQLGRRNLTDDAWVYFLGKTYEGRKRQGARTDLTSGNACQKSDTAAEKLADEKGVSEKSVSRATVVRAAEAAHLSTIKCVGRN